MKTILSFIVALCAAMIASCTAKEKVIGLRENIHHDDFEYSVQSVEKTDRIGNVGARGVFYIVAFQVENRAKRVDHRWDSHIAYLTDASGRPFNNDEQARQELNRIKAFNYKNEYITAAGVTETTLLVFDLPKDISEPYLQVRGSLLMGDAFDGNQYKKTKVKLF
jgi:hypothetical protein